MKDAMMQILVISTERLRFWEERWWGYKSRIS